MSHPIKPGEDAPLPTTRDELLIEALRTANRVCGAISEIGHIAIGVLDDRKPARAAMEKIHEITLRQFSDLSGVHLFIAAGNLRLDLPPDLCGEYEGDGYDGDGA